MFDMVLWITESIVGHRCSLLATIEYGVPILINHPDCVVLDHIGTIRGELDTPWGTLPAIDDQEPGP